MEQKKIRQILTITRRLDDCEDFDKLVNEALQGGWYLVKRYALPARAENRYSMLIAELQRYVENE